MMSRCSMVTIASALAALVAACSSDTTGGAKGSGGSGSGGASATGGTSASGGATGSGGTSVTGGQSGSGGAIATGGRTGAGGSNASGGGTGSGGRPGTGGREGTGGDASGGTSMGNGGGPGDASASGGRTGPGDGGPGDGPRRDVQPGSGGVATGGTGPGTGGAGGGSGTCTPKTAGSAQSGDITINPGTTYQIIDGFGIADVWQAKSTSSAQQRTLLWDPVAGIGMTLLRVGIDENGKIMGDAAFVDAPEVVKFGGKVWAAPWSPPANLKDNNNINNGGHLNTSGYETWATTLAAFPAYFKQNAGVDLWGLSPQNEPDFVASYRSCIYSAQQMNDFIKVLGPKLAALNPPVKIVAAEPDVWSHTWNNGDKYGVAIEGDATVSSLVEIIATHDYGSSGTSRPAPPSTMKHHLWQTEITYSNGAAIGAGLDIAKGIYAAFNTGGASGWLYWWTQAFFDGGSTSSPPKRVYAMGNFSKFVRPGYFRVGVSGAPSSVQMVAFAGSDGTIAIVAVNGGSSAVSASFFVSGTCWPSTVTPYVTSTGSNLAAGTEIAVTGGRFSGSLEAQSITTFVGKP